MCCYLGWGGLCRFLWPSPGLGARESSGLANKESHPWEPEGEGSTGVSFWDIHLLSPPTPHTAQSPSWEPIEKYINEQYEKFLKEEVNIARKKRIPDTRVHCCLYFISPTGHSYVPVPPPTAAPGSGSCQLCPFCLGEPVSPDGTQCRQGSVIAQTFSKSLIFLPGE